MAIALGGLTLLWLGVLAYDRRHRDKRDEDLIGWLRERFTKAGIDA